MSLIVRDADRVAQPIIVSLILTPLTTHLLFGRLSISPGCAATENSHM